MFDWNELRLMFNDPIDSFVFNLNKYLLSNKIIKFIFS